MGLSPRPWFGGLPVFRPELVWGCVLRGAVFPQLQGHCTACIAACLSVLLSSWEIWGRSAPATMGPCIRVWLVVSQRPREWDRGGDWLGSKGLRVGVYVPPWCQQRVQEPAAALPDAAAAATAPEEAAPPAAPAATVGGSGGNGQVAAEASRPSGSVQGVLLLHQGVLAPVCWSLCFGAWALAPMCV